MTHSGLKKCGLNAAVDPDGWDVPLKTQTSMHSIVWQEEDRRQPGRLTLEEWWISSYRRWFIQSISSIMCDSEVSSREGRIAARGGYRLQLINSGHRSIINVNWLEIWLDISSNYLFHERWSINSSAWRSFPTGSWGVRCRPLYRVRAIFKFQSVVQVHRGGKINDKCVYICLYISQSHISIWEVLNWLAPLPWNCLMATDQRIRDVAFL